MARVAASPASTVLLTGETGTGKDLAAKAIHYNSGRAARPFVNITASALPEQLLESELFGHERGAFTDARQQKRGPVEMADGGTVFLDEIGEMTPGCRPSCCVSSRTRRSNASVDLRTSASTCGSLPRRIATSSRGGGAESSARTFLSTPGHADHPAAAARAGWGHSAAGELLHRPASTVSSGSAFAEASLEAMLQLLERYRWPGNIRELRNAIERAMLLMDRDWLEPGDFASVTRATGSAQQFRAARWRCQPRGGRAAAPNPGARTHKGQPDTCGTASGHQSRPGAVSHREVRSREAAGTTHHRDGPRIGGVCESNLD